jgi:hypothetical protein
VQTRVALLTRVIRMRVTAIPCGNDNNSSDEKCKFGEKRWLSSLDDSYATLLLKEQGNHGGKNYPCLKYWEMLCIPLFFIFYLFFIFIYVYYLF